MTLEVFGYADQGQRIPGCTREVQDGETIHVGTLAARILFIPAHTSGHVAYYFEREQSVFTGDTLFAGGCGRLFEGDAAMMLRSLSKLMALPDATKVYFGHEYTEKNLRFALTLEPHNAELQKKHAWAVEQATRNQPTVPTTIASEKATNPFFRWSSPELRATLQRAVCGSADGRRQCLPEDASAQGCVLRRERARVRAGARRRDNTEHGHEHEHVCFQL